jgi:hypothetical protein
MAMSSKVKARIIDTINTTLSSIGRDKTTKPAVMKGNTSPIAWEFFVVDHLKKMIAARAKEAQRAAITAGVIFDHEKFPKEAGANETIYNDEYVSIHLTVNQSGTKINTNKLLAYLAANKVDETLLQRAIDAATEETRPAHRFAPSLVVSDTNGK